jgi:autotransporter-associated beta strand protein
LLIQQYNTAGLTISAVISSGTLTKAGPGLLTLNAAETYTGNTTITAGTLGLGSAGQFPNGAGKGNVVFNTAGNAATQSLNGFNATIGGLVQPSISNTNLVSSGSAAGTLTVGSNNATSTFGGVLTDGGGALALTKTGAGILMLISTNTYSGGTTISAGVLSFAANSLSSGNIAKAVQAVAEMDDIEAALVEHQRHLGQQRRVADGL